MVETHHPIDEPTAPAVRARFVKLARGVARRPDALGAMFAPGDHGPVRDRLPGLRKPLQHRGRDFATGSKSVIHLRFEHTRRPQFQSCGPASNWNRPAPFATGRISAPESTTVRTISRKSSGVHPYADGSMPTSCVYRTSQPLSS